MRGLLAGSNRAVVVVENTQFFKQFTYVSLILKLEKKHFLVLWQ